MAPHVAPHVAPYVSYEKSHSTDDLLPSMDSSWNIHCGCPYRLYDDPQWIALYPMDSSERWPELDAGRVPCRFFPKSLYIISGCASQSSILHVLLPSTLRMRVHTKVDIQQGLPGVIQLSLVWLDLGVHHRKASPHHHLWLAVPSLERPRARYPGVYADTVCMYQARCILSVYITPTVYIRRILQGGVWVYRPPSL